MKIALVQCPAFGIDKPPLALGYLAAILRKHGYDVNIFDLNIDLYSKTEEKNKIFWEFQYVFQWLDNDYFSKESLLPKIYFKNWARQILSLNPDVIGFSIQSSSLECSVNLAREIRNIASDKPIVFGGPLHLCYSIENAYHLLQLDNNIKIVDIVVLGEGEETLIEILGRIEDKSSLKGCLGTIIREGTQIINNGLRPAIDNLNMIPFPEFNDFSPIYKYKKRLPILGSRGCTGGCCFCDDMPMWRYYRARSAQNIFEEMKLRKEQGVEFLEFNDLLINANLKQLLGLCDLLIKERLGVSWGGSAIVDSRMDLQFLQKLKSAGCCYLNYGIESASPKVLREMNKGFSVEEARKIIIDTYRAGIAPCTNWIVGFPTETYSDFKVTINFVRDNIDYLKNNIMVNSFILKYASLLFKNKEKFGIVLDEERNWYSQSGLNTVEERKRRFDEFIKLLSELGDKPAHKTFQG